MNRFLSLVTIGMICMGALSTQAQAQAANPPLIVSATVDYAKKTLTISGRNFGTAPVVTLGSIAFPTQSSASTRVVARFPAGRTPSSFVPGTYYLTVQFRNQPLSL